MLWWRTFELKLGNALFLSETTTQPPTTTTPLDCIYDVTPEELAKDEPVKYGDGITADITPKGALEYNFPTPRPVSEITIQTKDKDKPLEVIFLLDDGSTTEPVPLDTSSDQPVKNDIPDQPNVVKAIIKTPDDSPLKPEDVPFAEVIACKEGLYRLSLVAISQKS